MNTRTIGLLTEELVAVLERLTRVLEATHEAVRAKLDAMRRVDVPGMQAAAQREADLAVQAADVDGRRRGLVAQLCQCLGLERAQEVALSRLAARLPDASRQRLLATAGRVRAGLVCVAEANRSVDLVCRTMLAHFRSLFAAMTEAAGDATTYSAGGESTAARRAMVLDATG